MPNFIPLRVHPPYRFYIRPDRHGHWLVREHRNLAGGVFLTQEGALQFALFETGGDATRVHSGLGSARRRGYAS